MTVVVSDLVARFRADLGDVQRGAAQARQEMAGVAAEAKATGEQLDALSRKFSQSQGGAASQWRDILATQKLSAAAVDEMLGRGAQSAQRLVAATQQIAQPTQAAARAAADLHQGLGLSETSVVRFASALVGVNLGLSLVAGTARLIHQTVADTVGGIVDWERSLKNLSGLYGEAGTGAAALAVAQAGLPGVLGDQREFAQAAINASALNLRYGLPQQMVNQLVTTGGRVEFATGMTEAADRAALQAQILAAVQTGANLPPQYGVYTDPEAVARRLGTPGAQSLQAYTPAELMQARQAIVTGDLSRFADRAAADRRAALDMVTASEKAAEQARTQVQTAAEGGASTLGRLQASYQLTSSMGLVPSLNARFDTAMGVGPGLNAMQGNAEDALRNLVTAQNAEAAALADSTKTQEAARQTFERLSQTVDAAGAKLFGFFGSLESPVSIAHGDILAQAQAAVTARARSAVPLFGMGAAEISALGTGTAWQAAWQNFAAYQAQAVSTNAIRRNLEQQADVSRFSGMSPDRQEPRITAAAAAQRALEQGRLTEPVYQAMQGAQTRAAQADLAASQTQASLTAIELTQRQRGLEFLQRTTDLRKLDNEQQQTSVRLSMDVTRAQMAALPVQRTLAAANYQSDLAAAISRQRMGRLLQGQSVADLPTLDRLINMNIGGQLAAAEAGPEAVQRAYAITQAQQPASAAALAEGLTSSTLQLGQLAVDAKNLSELPQQTALGLQLLDNNRDQLSVQEEGRELLKKLVWLMENQNGAPRSTAPAAPPDMPGARRGPF